MRTYEWPGLPVVLASGYAELPQSDLAAVAERLTKPFQQGQLAAALTRVTGRGEGANVVPLRGQDTHRPRASG